MKQTRYSHKSYIMDNEPLRKNSVWPGMIVEFSYKSSKAFSDPKPLVFILFKDTEKKLFHGVNLNYLSEYEVQQLFGFVRKIVPLSLHDKSAKTLSETTTRFQIPKMSEKIPNVLYEKVIKPKYLVKNKKCYRTYSTNKVSSTKVVSYKIEKDFRNWKGRDSNAENTNEG